MKYKNMKKKYLPLSLQMFAEGETESNGDDSGEGDDQDCDTDEDGEEDDQEEKKFSQKDMENAVKKRLARERRKWQREQQKKAAGKPESGETAGEKEESKETKELREKASKAEEMELKWTCLEHDVDKSCVDDVLALARVHMTKDKDMDIEDAIDKVLKKYPQFKISSGKDEDEEEPKGKAWGERQKGRAKKVTGVEAAFLKKNPGLKID